MAELSTKCSRKYRAYHTSGTRDLSLIKWIVMHDTEGGTAHNVARYFETPQAGGSSHLVVDDLECYRTLRDIDIPWAAPYANNVGFHIEMCGYAKWSTVIWKKHLGVLRRSAYKTAYHCVKFGIPPVFRTAKELSQGLPGVTTHAEVTKAFSPSGGHTDPGPFWPRRMFMWFVVRYYKTLVL